MKLFLLRFQIALVLAAGCLSPVDASETADLKKDACLPCLGQIRLDSLFSELRPQIRPIVYNEARLDDPKFTSLRTKLDQAANQRDAYASGLYWHKDLDIAKSEAVRTGRKILSLRLLGNLDEEYSCANSRFFRTILYPNPDVAAHLRAHYVLHWKSVRPAPLITIDMGDGRRIKRTLTGNSIHYILTASGTVLDALPGVYSPDAFLQALGRAEANTTNKTPAQIRDWHAQEASQLCQEWLYAAVHASVYGPDNKQAFSGDRWKETLRKLASEAFPTATQPQRLEFNFEPENMPYRFYTKATADEPRPLERQSFNAIDAILQNGNATIPFPAPTDFDPPKGMVERPVMKKALPGPANQALDPASPDTKSLSLAGRMTATIWASMAQSYRRPSLSVSSRRLMAQKQPPDSMSGIEFRSGTPESKSSFARMLDRFEIAIAGDMVRNEYFYHAHIHQLLETDSSESLSKDIEALNRKIYEELFLTPDYDAWLGMVPDDTYTALEKDGCACDPGAQPMRKKLLPK